MQTDIFDEHKQSELLGDVTVLDLLSILDKLTLDHALYIESARENCSPIESSEIIQKEACDMLARTKYGWKHAISDEPSKDLAIFNEE